MQVKDYIYEPLDMYKRQLRDEHAKNVDACFDDLVKRSGVDVEANAHTLKEFRKKEKEVARLEEKHRKQSGLRIFRSSVAASSMASAPSCVTSSTALSALSGALQLIRNKARNAHTRKPMIFCAYSTSGYYYNILNQLASIINIYTLIPYRFIVNRFSIP